MTRFKISKAIFDEFKELKIGVLVIKQFKNTKTGKFIDLLRNIEKKVKKEITKSDLADLNEFMVWRRAYSYFGAKPKKYFSSVEALTRRIIEGNEIPKITDLVDVYNYLSLKYKLPLGADDLDKVTEDIHLTFATGKERFISIGETEIKNPNPGEIVYKMGQEILCRRWNWRESEVTKVDENSSNVIIYCENLLGDNTHIKALEELQKLIGGDIRELTSKENSIDLISLFTKEDEFNEFVAKEVIQKKGDKKEKKKREKSEFKHWAQVTAERVIREKGDKKEYTVAAGITPSGVVHIGNCREIMTVELVKKALEMRGKKVRFIYSWDDYDVFRKVPIDMPKQDLMKQNLRKAIVNVPDPFECHNSYAKHFEMLVEDSLSPVGIAPEFLRQNEKYRKGEYVEQIKQALQANEEIKEILNNYRKEPLSNDWLPIAMFCPKCGKDTIKELKWHGDYEVSYKCECSQEEKFDFSQNPILKLKWRVDWPMRWAYENVDFEPGGKDHSTKGGSFDTGKQICKKVWGKEAPSYVMYDFVRIKGKGGKISSSKGNVVALPDVLEIYEPEIVRYMFAGTRPNREFQISFDVDVLALYEEFDKCERIYFGLENVADNESEKQKVAYELSIIGEIPKTIPYQPSFRHLTSLLQVYDLDVEKVIELFNSELKNSHDKRRVRNRTLCAKNWIEKYAPEEFKFKVQDKCLVTLTKQDVSILKELSKKLKEKEWTPVDLHEEIYILCKNMEFPIKDFFKLAYRVLINKDRGPKLAGFILEIGREKVAKLLGDLKNE